MNQQQEDSILTKYGELFSKTLSGDPNDQAQAESQIEEVMKKENRSDFIISCLHILKQYKDLDIKFINSTILYLNKAFSPDDKQLMLEIWLKQWRLTKKDNPNAERNLEIRNGIKDLCLELMRYQFPERNLEPSIKKLSSECLSRISIYDRGLFQDTFSSLVHFLSDKELEVDTRFAFLSAIKQFYIYAKIHRENDPFEFEDVSSYDLLLDCSIDILANFNLYNDQFITELLHMLSSFIYISPDRFLSVCLSSEEEVKNRNREKMNSLFQHIKEIAQNNSTDETILGSIHNFFFSFFEVIYDKSTFLVYNNYQDQTEKDAHINNFIGEFQLLFNEYIIPINFPLILPSTNVSYIAIDFWNEIGKFEKKKTKINEVIDNFYENIKNQNLNKDHFKIQRTKNFEKTPAFYVLHQFLSKLMPMMLQSMEAVNPDGPNADDSENQYYPYIYASLVVRRFFYFHAEMTFPYISEYFERTMSQEQVGWNIRNAQMQLISCICKLNNDTISEVVQKCSELMIQTIFQFKDNNIVLESTLSAFSAAFHSYKLFINQESVLQLFHYICCLCNEIESQSVILNCIKMLKEIIFCFSKEDTENQINVIIQPLKDFLSVVSGREDFAGSRYLLEFYSLKETIIDHINPGLNNEIIIGILNDSYNFCMDNIISDPFFGELHVFSFIMNLYGNHFIEQGLNLSSKLIGFLNGSNPTITTECLTCLIKIISGLGQQSEPILPQLKEQICLAYQSESPEIIIQVSSLLGSLFEKTGSMMYDILEQSVDIISQQISKARSESEFAIYFSHQIHYLIIPLAQILDSIPRDEPICLHIREQLFTIFYDILCSHKCQDQYEQSLFLESILIGYRAIVNASEFDIKFLKTNINKIFKIVAVLNEVVLPLSGKVVKAYCNFISSALIIMKKNPVLRIKLFKETNIKPLIWTDYSNDDDLKSQAVSLIDILLNRKK